MLVKKFIIENLEGPAVSLLSGISSPQWIVGQCMPLIQQSFQVSSFTVKVLDIQQHCVMF